MRKTVQIGSLAVELLANAGTPLRFKQIFHTDLLKELWNNSENDENINSVEIISQLAYVMNGQALGIIDRLTEDDYAEWLEQFESFDLIMSAKDILQVYQGNLKTDSTSKKKAVR